MARLPSLGVSPGLLSAVPTALGCRAFPLVVSVKFDRTLEVEWGEAQEEPIFKRWRDSSASACDASWALPSPKYCDWDRLVFDKSGSPICYLEIKRRRIEFAKYGDVLLPDRKVKFCVREGATHRIPFYLVTEYSCGSLVEVDLSQEPDLRVMITRRDRSQAPVLHALYEGKKIKLLVGPS